MQDDLDETENLILENSSLKDISEVLNKKINSTISIQPLLMSLINRS